MSKSYYLPFFTIAFFTVIAVLATGCAHKIDLRTVHLGAPIYGDWNPTNGHIYIKGILNKAGTVQFDRNSCLEVNQFGDSICTLMYFEPTEVSIERIELEDPKEKGRKVYQLLGNFPHPDYKYYLVVPSNQNEAYRLVVDDGTVVEGMHKRRVVTLERRN